jgi:hypothetical protein
VRATVASPTVPARPAWEIGTPDPCAGTRPISTLSRMTRIPRSVLVPAAILAGVCPLAANSLHEDSVGDGERILTEAATGLPVTAAVSVVLFLVGFLALIVVLGVLAAAIAPRTPHLAGVVAIAGAAAVAIKLAEAQTGMALRQAADVVDPGTAQVLVGTDEAGFVVHGFLISLALGAAALGLLRSGAVPAWLAWWGVVMGGLGVLAATVGILLPSAYVPIPYLLLLVWLVALGIVGARRPLAEQAPEVAVATPQ